MRAGQPNEPTAGADRTFPPSFTDRLQIIVLPKAIPVNALHLLVAGDGYDGETTETIGLSFTDGSTGSLELDVPNWWAIHWVYKSPIKTPFHFTSPTTKNFNATHIHHLTLPVPPHLSSSALASLHLPSRAGWNALHIFAATLIPSVPLPHRRHSRTPYPIRVRHVRGTHKWIDLDERGDHPTRAQVVEITLTNPFAVGEHARKDAWVAGKGLEVELVGRAVRTVRSGRLWRLMPGDEVVVQVGVEPGDVDVNGERDENDGVEVVLREMEDEVEGVEVGKGRVVGMQRVEVKGSGLAKKHGWGEWVDDVVSRPTASYTRAQITDRHAFSISSLRPHCEHRLPDSRRGYPSLTSLLDICAYYSEEHESPDWFNGAKFGIFIHWGTSSSSPSASFSATNSSALRRLVFRSRLGE